ncbi:hypothetical protein ABT324_31815 [Saccharopolyspora sp. NPDC000359]|uniref:hypothetical protein n=1 Tax=Saccharopolyspora sp. NPDC000359 TaxID=3154251 RepID=UPI003331F019
MSYPQQPDPYGSQSGPYSGQNYPSGQYPTGGYPTGYPQQGQSDDFWRQVAGNQPQPPMSPMPPKKKSTGLILGLVGAGVAVVGVVTLVVVMILNVNNRNEANPTPVDPRTTTSPATTSADEDAPITVGDCIGLLDESGGEMTLETCGTLDSDYEVVRVSNGADREVCGDDYSNVIDGQTYCIVLDVEVGDCITPYNEAGNRIPLKLDCSEAQDQITRVAPRGEPAEVCGEGDGYYNFAEKTFCFNDVRGA